MDINVKLTQSLKCKLWVHRMAGEVSELAILCLTLNEPFVLEKRLKNIQHLFLLLFLCKRPINKKLSSL